jgi:hypothetical protein
MVREIGSNVKREARFRAPALTILTGAVTIGTPSGKGLPTEAITTYRQIGMPKHVEMAEDMLGEAQVVGGDRRSPRTDAVAAVWHRVGH